MTDLLAVVVVGIGTLASRGIFIVGLANRTIPAPVVTALEYVGPATLAALIASMLVGDGGAAAVGLSEIVGLAATVGCALWTRNLTIILLVGMTAFWGTRVLL